MMPAGCTAIIEKETELKKLDFNDFKAIDPSSENFRENSRECLRETFGPNPYPNPNLKETYRERDSSIAPTILEFALLGMGGVGAPPGTPFGGGSVFTGSSLCVIADWDIDENNLAEQQYRCLAHDILRGKLDPSIKPSFEDKGKIDNILNAAGTHMIFEEMDLLYRFRYFLTENKKALIKFLLSVDWTVESEVEEVPVLLSQWKKKAPIDIADALRLLGKEKAFESLIVRQYAVETLRAASDEELLSFLLQLVQVRIRGRVRVIVRSKKRGFLFGILD
jgi:hypothetical protein